MHPVPSSSPSRPFCSYSYIKKMAASSRDIISPPVSHDVSPPRLHSSSFKAYPAPKHQPMRIATSATARSSRSPEPASPAVIMSHLSPPDSSTSSFNTEDDEDSYFDQSFPASPLRDTRRCCPSRGRTTRIEYSSRSSSVSSMSDEELERHFAACMPPLSNLPTPPLSSRTEPSPTLFSDLASCDEDLECPRTKRE